LEVDLLMGSFATAHVPTMTLQEMQAYERILSCETVDLFNYVSGQQPPPAVRRRSPRLHRAPLSMFFGLYVRTWTLL
jgi:succinate dehydrogenase flavin-adding protein (antitoxin of CptAB toxin-antitoxin module)